MAENNTNFSVSVMGLCSRTVENYYPPTYPPTYPTYGIKCSVLLNDELFTTVKRLKNITYQET